MREIRIAQSRREVERTNDLRHAHARLAGCARVAVGHIGRGLFAVAVDACDGGTALHLGEGTAQHGGHHEDMRYAVARKHVRKALGAGHAHLMASGLVGEPTAPVIGSAGATNRNSYTASAAQSSASSLT